MKAFKYNLSGKRAALVACVVCLITFFVNNEVIKPDIMESRNIISAREMVYDGHWLIPTLNGELRLEKPPLPTWLTAVAEMLSPDSIPLQRGMAGLAALLLVFYFWRFARRVLQVDPLIPTLLLCTCYNVILMGRTASWDIYCHAFMMGGIYHMARALLSPPPAWRHFLIAGLYTGLSLLSKGPVSPYALFLPFLLSFCRFYRASLKGKGLALTVMVVLALVLGGWWYAYVHLVQADALTAVVEKESGSWINHNVRAWWYYWKFFLEAGVWCLLLLTAIFLPLADKARRHSPQWLFSLCWMLASLVLLSLLPEKKSRYLLPLLIPASYLMGCLLTWWQEAFKKRVAASLFTADKWCFRVNTLLVALAVALLPVAAWLFLLRPGYLSTVAWILILLFAVALLLYLVCAAVRLRPLGLLGGITVLFLVAECLLMPTLGNVINNPDMKSIAGTRTLKALEGVPFYYVDTVPLRIELVYAAHRTIRPVAVDSIMGKLPCLLLTHRPVEETLPESALQGVETEFIDRYDDNRRPKTNRRYSDEFIYYATLLQEKETDNDIANE
ncbi:MAG: glycosyltransferase family 39 protein [Prevotellaceae bacterium]|nr:glycosyltransferase family 39 protein [Prevotellaceae bacterium]